jgi:hypothetical protein
MNRTNPDDIRKSVVDSLSNPSEDIARHVLTMAGANPDRIEKAITTGTGLVAYDLQAPAKNLGQVGVAAVQHEIACLVAGVDTAATPAPAAAAPAPAPAAG